MTANDQADPSEHTDTDESPATFFRRVGTKLTRRSLLRNSATAGAGALALSAGGGTAAAGDQDEEDGEDHGNGGKKGNEGKNGTDDDEGITDVDVLNFALTLEQLEYEFYRGGLETFDDEQIANSEAATRVAGDDAAASIRDRLTDIRNHEEAHVNVLTAVLEALGAEPVSDLEFEFPYETFDEFISLAAVFEPLGVDAYAGAAPFIDTQLLIPTALSIHSVEANHAAYLRDLNGENPVPQAFNSPAPMDSVVARASQFIVGLGDDQQLFAVTIENVSDSDTLNTTKGAQPVPLSPGAYAVHTGENPIYVPGESASDALERIAEDGFPIPLVNEMETSVVTELAGAENVTASGHFASLQGGLPAIGPGESTTFYVNATKDEALSFATMFVPSNDLFIGPCQDGDAISLYSDGSPISGEVTDKLKIYDAGTEENQPPGTGEDIKPNQPLTAIDVGPDEDRPIRPIEEVDDEFEYPAVSDVISVTIEPQ
ncbi:spondin domain-containing protein [Halosimplex aquaticum]|uniref:Spondin domain-containing protein n=1 Tax=Halosimplex aquaticum TaxID=3026162 RepID=A0ABD5Y2F8_9EURY|nr:spondin domain-containing protein [Halosimplex aquaticum]